MRRMHRMGVGTAINTDVPGALPSQELEQIVEPWFGIPQKNAGVQSASFDPPITDKCYRLDTSRGFKIPEGVSVERYLCRLPKSDVKNCDLSSERITAPGNHRYLIYLGEVSVPKHFFVRASPKSTQGRLGTYVRLVADGKPNFDEVEGPYEGGLWALFETHFFHIGIQAGDRMNQLRVFCRNPSRVEGDALLREFYAHNLLYRDGKALDVGEVNLTEGIPLTLDLKGNRRDALVGFRARNNPEPLSLRTKGIDPLDYFEEIRAPKGGQFDVPKNQLYILYSREKVRVPGHLAMEMSQYHRRVGATRLHKAGFFDPFFGFGRAGDILGACGVLELDTHEVQETTLAHGQSAGILEVQMLRKTSDVVYGEAGNAYQGQDGPRLAKMFDMRRYYADSSVPVQRS